MCGGGGPRTDLLWDGLVGPPLHFNIFGIDASNYICDLYTYSIHKAQGFISYGNLCQKTIKMVGFIFSSQLPKMRIPGNASMQM